MVSVATGPSVASRQCRYRAGAVRNSTLGWSGMSGRLSCGLADYERGEIRGAQADLVPRRDKIPGRRLDLPVAWVTGKARVRAARDLDPEPVPAAEPVRCADQRDPDGSGQRVGAGEADDAVADVA